jgi:queuine tRNA-ribosyltransferase
MGNTSTSISVFTSTGFQVLPTKEYLSAVQALKPDIAIPPADLTHGPITPNSKRALRMAERTDEWVVEWFSELADAGNTAVSTFAPVLPISYSIQWEYISRLAEDYLPSAQLSGLAIYDADVLPDLASYATPLLPLPRLSLTNPPTPHHILREIALGVDVFTLPFINNISDAGLALSFSFPPLTTTTPSSPAPPTSSGTSLQPLAIDLSLPDHATSLGPLTPGCTCYACTSHHRALIHHLLAAREMLGWTLLQIHNHAVLSDFFAGVRATLSQDQEGETKAFDEARRRFALMYEADFPEGVGEKPRARGYQYKSVGGGEAKKNKPAWGKLEEAEAAAAAAAAGGGANGVEKVEGEKGI